MFKRLCATLVLLVGLAVPASAQLGSVPYTFTAGTAIKSAEVNTNFSTAYANACNRTGCTMTATMTARSIAAAANNTYDIGSTGTRFKDLWIAGTATIATLGSTAASLTTATIGTANVTTGNFTTANITTDNVATLNAAGLTMTGTANTRDLIPTLNGTYSLGSGSFKYYDLWIVHDAHIDTDMEVLGDVALGGTTTTGDLFPASHATYKLGSTGDRWQSIYSLAVSVTNDVLAGGAIEALGTITADTFTTVSGNFSVHNQLISITGPSTNTGDPAVFAVTSGTTYGLYRQPSSATTKEHIEAPQVSDADLDAFLATTPKMWDYKGGHQGALGFIAEDLDALPIRNAYGNSPFINYDGAGHPGGNRDFALIAAQHLLIQRQANEIAQLRQDVDALKLAIASR